MHTFTQDCWRWPMSNVQPNKLFVWEVQNYCILQCACTTQLTSRFNVSTTISTGMWHWQLCSLHHDSQGKSQYWDLLLGLKLGDCLSSNSWPVAPVIAHISKPPLHFCIHPLISLQYNRSHTQQLLLRAFIVKTWHQSGHTTLSSNAATKLFCCGCHRMQSC